MLLDTLYKNTEGQLYSKHPNGSFDGFVADIIMSKTNDGQRQFLKFSIITTSGKAPDYKVFLFTENDALKAEHNAEYRDKLITAIQINKGILCNLGLIGQDKSKELSQNDMIRLYASLKGQKVEITIEDDRKDPRYQRVQINKIICNDEFKKPVSGFGNVGQKPLPERIDQSYGVGPQKSLEKAPDFSLDDIPF